MSTPSRTVPRNAGPDRQEHRIFPLQWLRGVAALLVVTFHAYQHSRSGPVGQWPFSGAAHQAMLGTDLFVDMFFVLSAFVLWLPVARTTLSGRRGRPGWLMLMRRVARLLPLYATVVIVVWALTNPKLPGHWQDLLLHLTFTHVYSDQYIFWTDGPAWSLGVEFHFYVLVAVLIPLVRRGARRFPTTYGRTVVLLLPPLASAIAGMTYLAVHIHVLHTPETHWSAWFNPLAKAPDFAIGMGLAVLCARGVRLPDTARRLAVGLSLAALVVLVAVRPSGPVTNWWHPAYAAAIAVALAGVVLHDGRDPAWMSWRPLVTVGGLGYGIYLIHEPVLRLLDSWGLLAAPQTGLAFLWSALLVSLVAGGLAWVSSRTVESGGVKVLNLVDREGRARDFYPHTGQRVRVT